MVPPQNIIPALLSSSLPNNQPNMKKRSRHFTTNASTDNEKPLNESSQQPMLSASIPYPNHTFIALPPNCNYAKINVVPITKMFVCSRV